MDEEFNPPSVIGSIFREVTRANRIMDEAKSKGMENAAGELSKIMSFFSVAGKVLGTFDKSAEEYFSGRNTGSGIDAGTIERLIEERNAARKNKDYKRDDAIRAELATKGIVLEDAAGKTTWSVKG